MPCRQNDGIKPGIKNSEQSPLFYLITFVYNLPVGSSFNIHFRNYEINKTWVIIL